jgi:hypothetical protein
MCFFPTRTKTYKIRHIAGTGGMGEDVLAAVLRIHDILVWIRIRGSMPLTNVFGCGSGSFNFHH